jgi:anti-anti-sigma factor
MVSESWLRSSVDGTRCEIAVAGEIDASNAGQLTQLARDTLHNGRFESLVIDLGAVSFLDSSALGSLVVALNTSEQLGKQLILANVGPRVLELLDLTGLTGIFAISEPDFAG